MSYFSKTGAKAASLVSIKAVENRIRALAQDTGLSLRLMDEPVACTSGREIFLQRPLPDWTQDEVTIWESSAYHEIGHCVPENKDIFTVIKDKGVHMQSRLGLTVNCLDDLRQEFQQFGRYRGRDRVMGEGCRLLLERNIDRDAFKGAASAPPGADPQSAELVSILYTFMEIVFEGLYPQMRGAKRKLAKLTTPSVASKVELLFNHLPEINPVGCDGPQVYARSLRVLELLGFDPEQEEQNAKDKKAAADQLSAAAQAFAEEVFGDRHTDDDVKSFADSDPDTPGSAVRTGVPEPHNQHLPTVADTTKRTSKPYVPTKDDPTVYDYTDRTHLGEVCPVAKEVIDQNVFLGTQVRRLLLAHTQRRYQHGKRSGKLGRNLHRAVLKDSGRYQERIFKQRDKVLSLDVAVSLGIDCSGSMGGRRKGGKYTQAVASAALMSLMLDSLHVDHEVVGFGESRRVVHGIARRFGKRATPDQINERLHTFYQHTACNNDGETLLWLARRLLQQDAARKLLIVFSDGQPSGGTGDSKAFLQKVTAELEAHPHLELYGIGIKSDCVKNYYTEYAVINTVESLPGALLGVLKTKLLQGGKS